MPTPNSQKISLQYKDCPRTARGQEIRATYPCDVCKGTGKRSCNAYRHNPVCEICGGSGNIELVDCPDCLGTGVNSKRGPCYTCKGCKVLSRLVADGINNAQGICADFQKNPTGTILRSLVYIAVIAITARPVWNAAFVDYLVVCDWYFIPGLFLLLMFSLIMKQSAGFFKGSSKQIIATYKRTGFSGGRHKVVRYNVHVNFP